MNLKMFYYVPKNFSSQKIKLLKISPKSHQIEAFNSFINLEANFNQ